MAGCDNGMIGIWDVQRHKPVLVRHITTSPTKWVMGLQTIDSRRFASLGVDRKLQIWSMGQTHQALHEFQLDHTAWCVHSIDQRMITGSDNGWVSVVSLDK